MRDLTYIPLAERAAIVEASRLRRLKESFSLAVPKKVLITYPGFKSEPSVLPGKRW